MTSPRPRRDPPRPPAWRLATRRLEPELMDADDLPLARHRAALAGLRRLNACSRAEAALWEPIAALARGQDRPLTLLDLACGSGDVPLALGRRARRAGLGLALSACDRSPVAVGHARERAAALGIPLRVSVADVTADGPLPERADVITCSLFLHHLDEPAAEALLRRMAAAARCLVLVCDLRRTLFGLTLAWLSARVLTHSDIVHADAPASVRAAFTLDELRRLAVRAGLQDARIEPSFPQRLLLTWRRP